MITIYSFLIIFLSVLKPEMVLAKGSCEVCHGKAKVDYEISIHKQRGISCVDCHGGDDRDMTLNSMSSKNGFQGAIAKAKLPEFCARCHSNVNLMLQYGEYIDQFAIYKESEHGKALFLKGDTNVAVCTDCHGVHDIKKSNDPTSPVYKLNVPATCAKCHSNSNLMSPYGIPTDQYDLYKESIHGKLRLEKRDLRSPGCPECHGKHGARPPGVANVHNVCGQCHFPQRDYFQRGPHSVAMEAQKINECASCHGSHGIKYTNLDLFVKDSIQGGGSGCLSCHQKDSEEYKLGLSIRDAIVKAENAIIDAEQFIEKARIRGFEVDEEMVKIQEAKSKVTELLPVTHMLALDIIKEYATNASINADDVKDLVNAKIVEWRDRRVMFVINIIIFLTIVILLIIKRRRMMRKV